MRWDFSCLTQPTSCRHLAHPAGVSGARQAPWGLTHIAVSGVSSGDWKDDTCRLQISLVGTLAETQGTRLELPKFILAVAPKFIGEGESRRGSGALADGRSLYELSCQAGHG